MATLGRLLQLIFYTKVAVLSLEKKKQGFSMWTAHALSLFFGGVSFIDQNSAQDLGKAYVNLNCSKDFICHLQLLGAKNDKKHVSALQKANKATLLFYTDLGANQQRKRKCRDGKKIQGLVL